jgi:hypothetical protein
VHARGEYRGLANTPHSKRKGVDKALHQIEEAIKKSRISRNGDPGSDVSKVISNLQHLLDKAQRQTVDRSFLSEQTPVADYEKETMDYSDSSLSQSNANNTTSSNPEDSLALDDAENPLQLLARASDLQLLPPSGQNNANSPLPLSSSGATTYSSHSSRATDSFFVPIKASLDVGPDLDPVDLGLVTFEEASMLFNL